MNESYYAPAAACAAEYACTQYARQRPSTKLVPTHSPGLVLASVGVQYAEPAKMDWLAEPYTIYDLALCEAASA